VYKIQNALDNHSQPLRSTQPPPHAKDAKLHTSAATCECTISTAARGDEREGDERPGWARRCVRYGRCGREYVNRCCYLQRGREEEKGRKEEEIVLTSALHNLARFSQEPPQSMHPTAKRLATGFPTPVTASSRRTHFLMSQMDSHSFEQELRSCIIQCDCDIDMSTYKKQLNRDKRESE